MKYCVYYSRGGCNYGDHSWGLEWFDTVEGAREFVSEQKKQDSDVTWSVIRGEEVEGE